MPALYRAEKLLGRKDSRYRKNHYEALPISSWTRKADNRVWPARQDWRWLADTENNKSTGFWENIDFAGPWDTCQPLPKDWLPEGGYKQGEHRYNKYGTCIDEVDGLPTENEKKAFICINQHRVNNGLQPMEWDQAAQVIAEIRSFEQNDLPKMAHTRPDGDSHIDPIMDECHSVGILAIKTHNGWLNENLAGGTIYSESRNAPMAVVGLIGSYGHNETFLASDTNYGAISDLGGTTCYNGLQMH